MLAKCKKYMIFVLFTICIMCTASCGLLLPMDVILTDEQIAYIEDSLTYNGDSPHQKNIGYHCVSIHIVGTDYINESEFEIYIWELSENMCLDEDEIYADGGASISLVMTAVLTGDKLEIVDVLHSTEGRPFTFPSYLRMYENGQRYAEKLIEKNIEKAREFYGV